MKWDERSKTADNRKTILTSFSLEQKQGAKIELKCLSFKHVKNSPTQLEGQKNLNLIKHSRFVILHFNVYKQLLVVALIRKLVNFNESIEQISLIKRFETLFPVYEVIKFTNALILEFL